MIISMVLSLDCVFWQREHLKGTALIALHIATDDDG